MFQRGVRLGLIVSLLAGASAWGAVSRQCGEIEFLTAKQYTLLAGSSLLAVVQESDGSYTAYPHQPYSPYKQGTPIPNFEQQLRGCLPAAPNQGTGLKIRTRPAGSPGSGIQAIPDAGDGTPAGLWNLFYKDSIQVWQANPDYTFRASNLYPVGQARTASLVGDYNKDSKPDIAVLLQAYTYQANEPSGIKVLPGKGDGTFGDAIFTALPNPDPRGFAQADFNRDGRMDMVVAFYDSTILLLMGNPDGTFTAATTFTAGGAANNVGAADLDGDGIADLQVLSTNPDKVYLYRGKGYGTFQQPSALNMPSLPYYVIGTDMNADGRTDLVLSFRFDSTVGVMLADGKGGFGPLTSYLASNEPVTLFPADVDQDGNVDIIVGEGLPNAFVPTEQNGYISVLFGRGDGTLIAAEALRTPKKFLNFTLSDVDGDGRADFIAVDPYANPQTFTVMLRSETGAFLPAKSMSVLPSGSYAYFSAMATGDFNKDGNVDLAFGEQSAGGVWISYGNGDGTFQTAIRVEVPGAVTALAANDLNGDGRADLAVGMRGASYTDASSVGLLLSKTSGGFSAPSTRTIGKTLGQLALTDLDGDQRPDLIIGDAGAYDDPDNPAQVLILSGNGDGSFKDPIQYKLGVTGLGFSIGDVNADGLPDLVVSTQGENYGDLIVVMANRGGGSFSTTPLKTDFGPGLPAITDLNGDDIPDLVIPHCCGATDMTYMVGSGNGNFEPEVHFAGGQDPTGVLAQDINDDGRPDLMVFGGSFAGSGGTIATLLNISPSAGDFRNVSGVSYVRMPLSPGSVAAAKGSDLATTFLQAPDSSMPQFSLHDTSLSITGADGNEYAAPLFLIDPTLVLYLIPPEVPLGKAKVTLTRDDGQTRSAPLVVANVAPALSPASSSGVAFGSVLWVSPDGQESWGNISTTDENGATVPLPIDLSNLSGHAYLVVTGTGFRNRAALTDVQVNLSGRTATPTFAGPMDSIPGMDQLRFELTQNLRDLPGDIRLSITVEGQTSNTVTFRVK